MMLKNNIVALALCILVLSAPSHVLRAQTSQTLTVTPPLFDLSVLPGDVWRSFIKVINSNPYDLTVYTEVVNFAPQGEAGQGSFLPVDTSDNDRSTLAEWIDISKGPYVIKREQTGDIPFFVDVPKDAPPGGHFAAVLITTQPPEQTGEPLSVVTSQSVTTLFFMRVEGDVIERATIREFRVLDSFVESPEAEFSLRFENKGNVHLQPRGDIIITNMWGKERGIVPVNHNSNFGNVLPESIRDFRFSWKGERALTEIGRYRAIATLGYGENESQSVTSMTYFWVIPIKATLITLGALVLLILMVTWMIRLYVRRMLALAGVDIERVERVKETPAPSRIPRIRLSSYKAVAVPITKGASDLRSRLRDVTEFFDVLKTIGGFVLHYKVFFGSLLMLIAAFVGLVLYVSEATRSERNFEVTIHEGDTNTVLDSEEVLRDRAEESRSIPAYTQPFTVELINASGEVGLGADIAKLIEEAGYRIDRLDTATETRKTTAVTYHEGFKDIGTELTRILTSGYGNSLSPALESDPTVGSSSIRILLGEDAVVE